MPRKRRSPRQSSGIRSSKNEHRPLRVGEMLRKILTDVLSSGALRDPAFADATVVVTEVRVSGDLGVATVFVAFLGAEDTGPMMAALERSTPAVRRLVAAEISLRHVPELLFRLDTSFDDGARIEELLDSPRVRADLDSPGDD